MRPDPRVAGTGRRALRRPWRVFALACAGAAAAPAELAAQGAPADTAAVLLDVARQLEAEGNLELTGVLLTRIVERYPGTPAARRAASSSPRPRTTKRHAGATAAHPPPGALLDLRDGHAAWGMPLPVPTVLARSGAAGRSWEPGLRLSLFEARF